MTKEEIKDELYRMLSDVVNGGYPKRNNTQKGRYRKAVEKAIEALQQEPCKVGHWISNAEDDLKISEYTCSNCKGLSDEDSDFCPKCGSYNGGVE